jgi:hypothetical protein
MFRICKVVSPWGNHVDSPDFYYTTCGLWSQTAKLARIFTSESEVDKLVDQLNKKADKHFSDSVEHTFQITTYLKEEI